VFLCLIVLVRWQTESFEEEQRWQYLQHYLRRFCLSHGAALVYASAHDDTNRLQLQRYLLHRWVSVCHTAIAIIMLISGCLLVYSNWTNTNRLGSSDTSSTV
jgi:uncharacterized membrane protein YcjF (UPF0283 family)